MKKAKLTPNGYYLLYCLDKNEPLDLTVPYSTEMHKLKLSGYLDDKHNLTDSAIEVMKEIDAVFKPREKAGSKLVITDEFKESVAKYREMFPKGVVSGKALRNGTLELTTRLLWFFREHPQYTWEHVYNATQNYINSFGTDLTYCKTSAYFIKKEDKNKNIISLLADWCEAELDNEKDEPVSPIIGFNKLV